VIFNSDYEKGMSTSAQAGIRGLPAEVSAAALFLVDHPIINPATIDILAKHVSPGRIILPTHSGKRGHPVLFAAELFPEILSLPSNAGLNTIVRRDAARIVEVSVDFRGILTDVDTPDDYAKLLAENA
jgi:molybdenum cofactor cytidylyltransferase